MSARQELAAAVRTRAAGTPYVVDETPEGFDVRLELENPRWTSQFREWQLTRTSVHHVRLEDTSRRFTVTDEDRSLTWQAGADGRERPTFGASLGFVSGRVKTWTFQRTYSIGRGGLKKESEVTFDSSVGRDLAVDAAKAQGWKLRRGLNERIGLYVGVTTIVLMVLAGLVIGIVALAGGFS